ncbi:ret finger protein-like 4A [Orycteropus afer afer]|uniref:Ret finger protein-like 4A n=1 Tax=Orycteropus afer afer TaxID=1230840 RepID=A0A8B7B7B2_ORYAF|nr:ret finger protein-like 4A [Orycteropus afer afer]
MAEFFQIASKCPVCLTYFEKPVYLKCGHICCLHCLTSVRTEPDGEGVLCPICPVVTQKNDLKICCQLGTLVSKIKELEPHLRAVLQLNPRMLKFQVDTTLDADTAHNLLVISEDLRSVRCGSVKQKLKEHTERFSQSICVLGSSRFTSGRHYWEVDVGTSQEWDVGVCRESINRQEKIIMSTDRGFWILSWREGWYFSASTTPPVALLVSLPLRRVGVFLDLDIGNLSFCNVGDGSHIFTFTKISASEPLRPFFGPSIPRPGDHSSLSICPVVVPSIPSELKTD